MTHPTHQDPQVTPPSIAIHPQYQLVMESRNLNNNSNTCEMNASQTEEPDQPVSYPNYTDNDDSGTPMAADSIVDAPMTPPQDGQYNPAMYSTAANCNRPSYPTRTFGGHRPGGNAFYSPVRYKFIPNHNYLPSVEECNEKNSKLHHQVAYNDAGVTTGCVATGDHPAYVAGDHPAVPTVHHPAPPQQTFQSEPPVRLPSPTDEQHLMTTQESFPLSGEYPCTLQPTSGSTGLLTHPTIANDDENSEYTSTS